MSLLRRSWKSIPCGGAVALALGTGLSGCRVATDLADLSENDAGGGGTPSMGSGGSDAPGHGGESAQFGGTGGTSAGGSGTGGTAGGECWEPTVENFCANFDCPRSSQHPAWPTPEEVLQNYEDTGVCAAHTVTIETDGCGGYSLGYVSENTSESYLWISGTLAATSLSRATAFGPCDQTSYYGGITKEGWDAYGDCHVESRCIACGSPSPDERRYPPCRSDCDCQLANAGSDLCSDEDSCDCYCQQISTRD